MQTLLFQWRLFTFIASLQSELIAIWTANRCTCNRENTWNTSRFNEHIQVCGTWCLFCCGPSTWDLWSTNSPPSIWRRKVYSSEGWHKSNTLKLQFFTAIYQSKQTILFSYNVQHDCRLDKCTTSGNRGVMQEWILSEKTKAYIEHKPVDRYLVNTHAFHNVHLIRATLPRHLTIPIPYAEDRQAHHIQIAAKLQVSQEAKWIQTARKAEDRRKSKGTAKKSNKWKRVSILEDLDPDEGEEGEENGWRDAEAMEVDRDDADEELSDGMEDWLSHMVCPNLVITSIHDGYLYICGMDYRHNEHIIIHKIPRWCYSKCSDGSFEWVSYDRKCNYCMNCLYNGHTERTPGSCVSSIHLQAWSKRVSPAFLSHIGATKRPSSTHHFPKTWLPGWRHHSSKWEPYLWIITRVLTGCHVLTNWWCINTFFVQLVPEWL